MLPATRYPLPATRYPLPATRIAYSVAVGLLLLFVSCKSQPQEFRQTKNLSEITGSTFVLPANPKWVILDRDTTITLTTEPRLVVYLNGSACTPCALKELRHWKPIIKQVNSQILFILQTSTDNQTVKQALVEQQFEYPVMCDEKSDFARYNLLPANELYHVFLLDKDNRVMMVGNPLISMKQWSDFKKLFVSLNKK